jgi:hypothetical protein
MKSFKQYLGPEATKKQDTQEVSRQKKNLDRLSNEYNKMSKDEGGGGMAKAHADMFSNTKKAIHHEHIEKVGGGYEVESEHGNKNLGKTKTLAAAKKRLGQIEYFKHMKEDGGAMVAAPTNSVAGVAGSGDSRTPASQREPGVSKKRNPIVNMLARRALPKV